MHNSLAVSTKNTAHELKVRLERVVVRLIRHGPQLLGPAGFRFALRILHNGVSLFAPCLWLRDILAVMPASLRNTLNARQEAICRGLAEGKSQSRAYVEAGYDARGNAAEGSGGSLTCEVDRCGYVLVYVYCYHK